MESEKVENIKKAIECCEYLCCGKCPYSGTMDCVEYLNSDMIDYINELENQKEKAYELLIEKNEKITKLENENELLRNAKVVYENVDYCYEDLKKAEKRIAELEKENLRLANRITCQVVMPNDKLEEIKKGCFEKIELAKGELLKQFAEMLKEKLEEYRLENEYFIKDEPNGNLWQMNSSVFCIEVTQDGGLVDETLKEMLGEE